MTSKKAEKEIQIYFKDNRYLPKRIEKAFLESKMKSKNDFYLQILNAGIDSFWRSETDKLIDKKNIKDSLTAMVEFTENLKLVTDEMFVQQAVLKHLLVTLYNLKIKELEGIIPDIDEINNGTYSAMPDRLALVLDNLKADLEGAK